MLVAGGEGEGGAVTDSIEFYDPEAEEWTFARGSTEVPVRGGKLVRVRLPTKRMQKNV